MNARNLIAALAFAGLAASPAWAEHEGHQHGQDKAAAPAAAKEAAGKAPDDMKSGGKSCKKCKPGKSGKAAGGGGHDHGGHDHGGAEDARAQAADGDVEALNERVRQLEKRLDVMQTLLEVLAERRNRAGERGGGRAGHH